MQLDPIKPTLKPPGSKRLNLKCADLVSSFAFNFNLRRYIKAHNCIIYNVVDDSEEGLVLADGTVYTNVFVPGQAKPLVQTSSVSTDGGKVFKAGAYTRYHESST